MGILEEAKKVTTKDTNGNPNGGLVELFKDGDKTLVYMINIPPGAFKGYHLHHVRIGRYFCLKGKTKVTLHKPGTQEREEYILDAEKPQRLVIPVEVAAGLENIGDKEVWLVNYPDPPYDPSLEDEQVDYTEEELQSGIVK